MRQTYLRLPTALVTTLISALLAATAVAATTHTFRSPSERHRATIYAERQVEALERHAGATAVTIVPGQSYCQRVDGRPQIAQCMVITLTNRRTDPPVSHRTEWLWPVLIAVQRHTGRLRLDGHPKPQWLEEPCPSPSKGCEVIP